MFYFMTRPVGGQSETMLGYDVEQTGYSVSLWRVSSALKIAYEATKARAFPVEVGTK